MEYNFEGRYEVIVYGVMMTAYDKSLIPNSDHRTNDLREAIKVFNSHRDAPYGADLWDHVKCEDIASHNTENVAKLNTHNLGLNRNLQS